MDDKVESVTSVMKNDEDKLSILSKLGYGFGEAGSQCSWALISGYLTLFYTDVVGLMPATIAVILMIARVWDAVNDPLFGSIAENSTFKLGRYRTWILIGLPFLVLFNCLTFLNLDISNPMKAFWCGFTYIFCGTAYTVVNISTGALANNMTTSPTERASLQSWRGILSNAVSFVLNLVTMPMILFFGAGSTSSPKGYFWAALIFSIIAIPFFILCVRWTKEVVLVKKEKKKEKATVKSTFMELGHSFKVSFADHDTRYLLLATLFNLLGVFGRFGIISYYFVYILKDSMTMATTMSAMTIGATISYLYGPWAVKRMNKKTAGIISSITNCLTLVGFFIIGELGMPWLSAPLAFAMGITNLSQFATFSMAGEIVDDNWIRTGKRTEGVTYSAISFATKAGNAVGGSIGILGLAAVGFVANTDMSSDVLTKMNAIINLVPIALLLIGAFCFSKIRMTNEKAQANEIIVKKMLAEDNNRSEE